MEPSRLERSWIPIRILERNKRFFACAFCDLGTRPQFPHVSSFRTLLSTGGADSALGVIEDMDGSGDAIGNAVVPVEPTTSASVVEEHPRAPEDPIFQQVIQNSDEVRVTSFKPLSPVNCVAAVDFDNRIEKSMLYGGCYIITAPKKCEKCGSARDEETQQYGDEGVIACAKGPCAMKVEFFQCKNSMCRALTHSEGREAPRSPQPRKCSNTCIHAP